MTSVELRAVICRRCIAAAGRASDRCQRCEDFSLFNDGKHSMNDLDGLSGRGKMAYVLSALPAMEKGDRNGYED